MKPYNDAEGIEEMLLTPSFPPTLYRERVRLLKYPGPRHLNATGSREGMSE